MNVYYIKLKTGEELLGVVDDEDLMDVESSVVYVQGAITFDVDVESGSTIARYWVAYSDHKDVNIDLKDTYFFGSANDQAGKFYNAFLESVQERDNVRNLDVDEDDVENMLLTETNKTIH
ncbi:hypothetical protein PHIM7_37 [Sinorhizobium phage phiM7]|uniref:Uncharacterized protein n=2 Tax=Emdodecavirus TaxID=1980937 RepID=S5MAP5_9CAUD|nr:hypothetical protein AB690_gp043 [Sinorhizobium phage phiM12]YP_009601162.1 hypothetical protein FDH46_gp037 [Sinorhizobium phage phiM7]AGR47683.1 hypothetical protein SmphiM12_051 [Sinorhizobium phage phiM12]AKF12585.1 hypothetical protein PHIM7_37 [Sinorhizobium phage phiM7]AKF12945.1 hypothetical protein PHIM19_38 [Sinorhizobium phage phiM19]